jgi:hypothetical protein
LATRGVPRERSAIARAPAASMATPRTPALRTTMRVRSAGA